MKKKPKFTDEFIYESFVKASRFHITLTVSTIGVIIALVRLPEMPIEISKYIVMSGLCFLAAIFLSVMGQLLGTIRIMEKRKIEKPYSRLILGGFWVTYVPGISFALLYLANIAKP